MIRFRLPTVVLLASLVVASRGETQQPQTRAKQVVLFVCEHGTVKSLLAKVLFEQYAKEVGLDVQALSRGTHADSVVPSFMLRGLASDHVTLGSWRPQTLAPSDLASATYVVSLDVPSTATAAARVPRTQWDGLPSVTQDYARGRDSIKARVHQLVDSLKRAEGSRPR